MFEGSTVEEAGPVDCLLPLDGLEVVPEDLALHSLVRHTATVGDGVGSVLHRDDTVLLYLAVLGAGVDAVDDNAPALLVELPLEDPGVDVDGHFGDGVGTVGPAFTLPPSSLGEALELVHQTVCRQEKPLDYYVQVQVCTDLEFSR